MKLSGIDRVRERLAHIHARKSIGIMTHTVIGYPSVTDCTRTVRTMADNGADYIELQIPFSDPIADGPVILNANQRSLAQGMTVKKCFEFMKHMRELTDIPLLFITYANIPFQYGIEAFCKQAAASGAAGIIVPDLPFDDAEGLYIAAKKAGICSVPVVSEVTSPERFAAIDEVATGFIYVTARIGVTGAKTSSDGIKPFLKRVKKRSNTPLAVGFGIASATQVRDLVSHADIAVIGSHLVTLSERKKDAPDAIAGFMKSISFPLSYTAIAKKNKK
ncbi:MAG: tryptophan synthase subunit alpha [Spirochaetes bacterium]|nr:tryptophan synthase subunit alpha [Spirochaetota bacterium]